jgi:hypothetical protein
MGMTLQQDSVPLITTFLLMYFKPGGWKSQKGNKIEGNETVWMLVHMLCLAAGAVTDFW